MINRMALKTAAKIRMAKAGVLRLIGMTLFILVAVNIVSFIIQARLPEVPQGESLEEIEQYIEEAKNSKVFSPAVLAITFIYSLFASILSVGYSSVCLKVARGIDVRFGDLFDGFSYGLKIIGLNFLMGLIVAFGYMLFVIPGIVLNLAYSQAIYILIDDPSVGIIEALRRSRKLMKGHKVEFWVFNLSYIGWYILSSLFILGDLWVQPYVGVGTALYYESVTGKQSFHLRRRESGEYEFYAGSSENNPFDKKEENTEEDKSSGDSNE